MAATTTEENPMIRLRPSDDDGVVDGGLLISKKAALGSSFFKTIIDSGCDLGADGIAIAAVNKKVLEHIIKFLELKATQEPKFVKIFRPLRSANLVDSDVPLWAKTFVDEIPPDLLADVVEGAEYLKTDMLRFLCLAQIAALIISVTKNDNAALFKKCVNFDKVDEAELKKQNDFAWKEDPKPIEELDVAEAEAEAATMTDDTVETGSGAGAGGGEGSAAAGDAGGAGAAAGGAAAVYTGPAAFATWSTEDRTAFIVKTAKDPRFANKEVGSLKAEQDRCALVALYL